MNKQSLSKTEQEKVEVLFKFQLTLEEVEALNTYTTQNAIKKGPWLRLLMIQELQSKQFLQRPDYVPPTTASALTKRSRK